MNWTLWSESLKGTEQSQFSDKKLQLSDRNMHKFSKFETNAAKSVQNLGFLASNVVLLQ